MITVHKCQPLVWGFVATRPFDGSIG